METAEDFRIRLTVAMLQVLLDMFTKIFFWLYMLQIPETTFKHDEKKFLSLIKLFYCLFLLALME